MTGPPAPGPDAPPSIRRAATRFAVLGLVVAALAALVLLTPAAQLLEREVLAGLLSELRQAWWAPLALIGGYLVVAPSGIPVSPLIFAGGAVFGPLWGWLYSALGCLLGGVLSFAIARGLGKELVEHLAGERRMQRVEAMLEQHGFWTLVGIRFLPIPFALVNYGAALAGFRFSSFLGATALGLIPSVLMWNYLAHSLVSVATEDRGALLRNAGVVVGLVALLVLLRPLGRALLRRGAAAADD